MADCCSTILDLGCEGFCDTVTVTGVTAPVAGTYTVSIVNGGGFSTLTGVLLGAVISFTNVFNEDAITVFQILDTQNNDAPLTNAAGDNCFQIRITPSLVLT